MSSDQIVCQHRVAALADAETEGTISETCWVLGIYRKTLYKSIDYGLDALMPKNSLPTVMPNATPADRTGTSYPPPSPPKSDDPRSFDAAALCQRRMGIFA